MKSVSLKFKLPLPLLLLLIFGALAVITLFIDLKIIDDFSQASSDTVAGKSLELNQNLYQIILNNNKTNTTLSQKDGVGRVDPFADVQ